MYHDQSLEQQSIISLCSNDQINHVWITHSHLPHETLLISHSRPFFVHSSNHAHHPSVGSAPPTTGDNISVSNPFDDPVGPQRPPYQQGAPYPPASRPQGMVSLLITPSLFARNPSPVTFSSSFSHFILMSRFQPDYSEWVSKIP